jgi:hypothetical protein
MLSTSRRSRLSPGAGSTSRRSTTLSLATWKSYLICEAGLATTGIWLSIRVVVHSTFRAKLSVWHRQDWGLWTSSKSEWYPSVRINVGKFWFEFGCIVLFVALIHVILHDGGMRNAKFGYPFGNFTSCIHESYHWIDSSPCD